MVRPCARQLTFRHVNLPARLSHNNDLRPHSGHSRNCGEADGSSTARRRWLFHPTVMGTSTCPLCPMSTSETESWSPARPGPTDNRTSESPRCRATVALSRWSGLMASITSPLTSSVKIAIPPSPREPKLTDGGETTSSVGMCVLDCCRGGPCCRTPLAIVSLALAATRLQWAAESIVRRACALEKPRDSSSLTSLRRSGIDVPAALATTWLMCVAAVKAHSASLTPARARIWLRAAESHESRPSANQRAMRGRTRRSCPICSSDSGPTWLSLLTL